jgi:DNA-binding response OmpR family regulator
MAIILIVDDEQAFAEIGQLILERAGFTVGVAPSAVDAMKMIETSPPDLILCDVEMPQMDGFEFLRLLRSNPRFRDLPFVFMSARRTYPTDRVQGLDLGSDDYIGKPFSGDELISRVKAILRRVGKSGGADLPSGVAASEPPRSEAPSGPPPQAGSSRTQQLLADVHPALLDLKWRLARREPVAVLYVNLSFFRGYNEAYGYEKGDEVLRFTFSVLEAASRSVSEGKDPVCHLWGDDFMVLTDPSRAGLLCHAALREFTKEISDYYAPEDRERGFVEGKTRQGRAVAYPFINLVIGAASNQQRSLTHVGQFAQVGKELIRYAKTLGGSRFVVDRRKDPAPPAAG